MLSPSSFVEGLLGSLIEVILESLDLERWTFGVETFSLFEALDSEDDSYYDIAS